MTTTSKADENCARPCRDRRHGPKLPADQIVTMAREITRLRADVTEEREFVGHVGGTSTS